MRCTRCTASASPRHRNVHRSPSTIGASWRARNRSTAAASGRRSFSRLIASLIGAAASAPSLAVGLHDQRVRRQRRRPGRGRARTPSSSTTQRAGAAAHGQLGHPGGSSTRSRRRACGSSTAPGIQPSPTSANSACDGPFAARSWNSSTRSVSAIAPADQATTVGGAVDGEQPQHVPQHPDVPARDHQRRGSRQPPPPPRPGAGHRRALRGPPPLRERGPLLRDPREVPLVDEPDDGLGVGAGLVPHPRAAAAAPGHLAQRAQHPVELHEVQLLLLGERGPVLALGLGVLRVALQHVLPAGVQGQVDAAAVQQRVELGVVGLAFLPARRDRRDRAVEADGVQRGPPLRAQHDDHQGERS